MKDKFFFIIQGILKYNSFNWGVKLRSILYRPFFKEFGKNIQIRDGVTFKYPSEIRLGDGCKIGEHCFFVGKSGLTIGNKVLIGAGTKIITSTHITSNIELDICEQGLEYKPVIIGSNIWFGFDVKVLPESIIGDGSIIGASSVIFKINIPKNSVVVGIPAKIIKNRKGE